MSWPGWEDFTPPSTSDPLRPSKRSKYGAVKTIVDGITFASKKEAARYGELKLLEKAGEITDLTVQPAYPLAAYTTPGMGLIVGEYRADFSYRRCDELVVEDVKSPPTRTQLYRWKVRHMLCQYGIQVIEI